MAEMSAASAAMDLSSRHAETPIDMGPHGTANRRVEAWPAGTALELRVGSEQGEVASGTDKGTAALFMVERAAAGRFGCCLP